MSNRRLKWYLALCAAGMGSAAAAVAYMTRRVLHDALPTVQGSRTLQGLRRPVEIIRDPMTVPHIYAENEEDLFFAQGYVQAQDRLFQMDMHRRVGYGRLSEIAGPLGVPSDRLARICGWHHAAEAQWRGMQEDVETKTMAGAFAAGVNAFIGSGSLPAEYRLLHCAPEPWQPRDGAAWGAVLAWGLSVNWKTELLRLRLVEELGVEKAADLTPGCEPGYPTVYPGAEIGSRLGKSLLQAYRHALQQLPLAQLSAGSGLGSNNWVVNGQWTSTGRPMLANDPHLPPLFPTLWVEGQWQRAKEYEEIIRAMLDICRAGNWSEFRVAVRHWAFPSQKLVYADVEGNVGHLMPGRVPQRKQGEGLLPVPGWGTAYDWEGWIAPEELPALLNPERGYVVTANNQVTGDDYAYLLTGEWLAPYRARRIAELIEALAPLNVAQHACIQTDTVSLATLRFTRLALDAMQEAKTRSTRQDARRAVSRLQDWDGDMRADAVEPSLAYGWLVCFVRAAVFKALGPQLAQELLEEDGLEEIPIQPFHDIASELALRWLENGPPAWVGEVHSLLPGALEGALDILQRELGPEETSWWWGRLHYVELHSFLAGIPGVGKLWKPLAFPLGGDGHSVNQARVPLRFPPGAAHVIASCCMILDVGAWDNSVSTLPGGQSGHPASDHYQDSVEDWLQGKYHPMLYSRERVEARAQNRLSLRPEEVGESSQT